jgi:hypothetical protein
MYSDVVFFALLLNIDPSPIEQKAISVDKQRTRN